MSLHPSSRPSNLWHLQPLEAQPASKWLDYPLLLLVALFADLLTPLLIWKHILPDAVRWISDLAVATLLLWTLARMVVFNRVPLAFPLMLTLTAVGVTTAGFEGQQGVATAWGWWVMFRYPMLGIYTYLQPAWPENFARPIKLFCVVTLGFEVLVQIGQFLNGQIAGDDLAGTFGRHGVGHLSNLLFFTLCLVLAHWLVKRDGRLVVIVAVLGSIASSLAAIKFFPVALVILATTTGLLYWLRGGNLLNVLLYFCLLSGAAFIFVTIYNYAVVDVRADSRPFETYLQLDTLDNFENVAYDPDLDRYQLGRTFAAKHGWQLIQRDGATLLFGMGLGARNESRSLGIVGKGLQGDDYGTASGTSLLVLMQELGLAGLGVFGLFIMWVVVALFRAMRTDSSSDLTILRYGLILYSIFWPLWLWYHQIWEFSVTMMLYWGSLGYALNRVHQAADRASVHRHDPVQGHSR